MPFESELWVGPCASCCECASPTLMTAANSGVYNGSCGFYNAGAVYLARTNTITSSPPSGTYCITVSGSLYATETYTITSDGTCSTAAYPPPVSSCGGSITGTTWNDFISPSPQPFTLSYNSDCNVVCTGTDGCCGGDISTFSYSELLPDSSIIGYAVAHQAGYGRFTATNRTSSTYLFIGEGLAGSVVMEAYITDIQYYFALPTPVVRCYVLAWDEVTRDGSGTIISSVAKSYTWDGTATQTPTITITHPASNGSVGVENLTTRCDGC